MNRPEIFQQKYGRPTRLSDPHHDFEEGYPTTILAKADEALGWKELQVIFQGHLPAATYEEGVYFLPTAFAQARLDPDGAGEFLALDGVLIFLAQHVERFQQDGLWDELVEEIKRLLAELTADFSITHVHQDACQAQSQCVPYADYVNQSHLVSDLLKRLDQLPTLANIALDFVRNLSQAEPNTPASYWYLEICKEFFTYHHKTETPQLRPLLNNYLLHKYHLQPILTQESLPNPTYWETVIDTLGGFSYEPEASASNK